MAILQVTYQCGHLVRQKIYGRRKDREKYVENLKEKDCPDCLSPLDRPYGLVYFFEEIDRVDILLQNVRFLRHQLKKSTHHYRYITLEDCEGLPIKMTGWYKILIPAEQIFNEIEFCLQLGIRDFIPLNSPTPPILKIIQFLENKGRRPSN